MKRVGNLFDRICTRENLGRAFHAAARGKRDRLEVRLFSHDLDGNLEQMSRSLAAGDYAFSAYSAFEVRDTKSRTIHAPAFRDRVVHHAITAITGPVLERGALPVSFACRRGYGQHRALALAQRWTRRGQWYGKMDVQKFYDSVQHDVVREMLARRFREQRLLALYDRLLASYQISPGRGLPIGALTSQFLGNFLLDRLDHAMKATGRAQRYLRYMDDAVVWASRDDLPALRDTANAALSAMGLRLKHGGEWNRCDQGLPFLGFTLYPDRTRLNKAGRVRLRRKWRQLERDRLSGAPDAQIAARAGSLFAHAKVADDVAWRRVVLAFRDFGEGQGSPPAGRLLEQHAQELPLRLPQQERTRQPQQEQRVPPRSGPRHAEAVPSTDDAPSRAPASSAGAETTGKPPPPPDTPRGAWRKGDGGAPVSNEFSHD